MHAFPVPGANAALCYHDFPGKSPAVVFIHGLGAASSEAFPVVARHAVFAAQRLVLVDLLGFGYADRPEAFGYTIEEHADSVAALLQHLDLRACRVMGHSMGGAVVTLLAARHPDLVGALAVAEGNLDPGKGTASLRIAAYSEEAYVHEGHAAFTEELAASLFVGPAYGGVLRSFRRAAPYAVHRSARSLVADRQPTFRQALEGLSIPRTFIVGTRSLPGYPEAELPNAGVAIAVVADAGHVMNVDNPDGFARAVADAFSTG